MRLEKAINPLLDDNDVVAFNYMLLTAVDAAKATPKSHPFHVPVDTKKVLLLAMTTLLLCRRDLISCRCATTA